MFPTRARFQKQIIIHWGFKLVKFKIRVNAEIVMHTDFVHYCMLFLFSKMVGLHGVTYNDV